MAADFDWEYLKKSRDSYIERLNGIYERNLDGSNVVRIEGVASLELGTDCGGGGGGGGEESNIGRSSRGESGVVVRVTTSEGSGGQHNNTRCYKAKHILLSTGGYPTMPPSLDSDHANGTSVAQHAIDSDGFFALTTLPSKVVIVGGGYIAVELAGVLRALGSDTSLVVRKERALRNFDDLLSSTLDEEMERRGIRIYRNTNGISHIIEEDTDDDDDDDDVNGGGGSGNKNGKKTVYLNNGEVIEDVNVVCIAVGRSPSVETLNLKGVGVDQNEGGYISVNAYSETSVEGIYAVGDVTGNVELTPMGKLFTL